MNADETQLIKNLSDYGALGVVLIASLWANVKMAISTKGTFETTQDLLAKLQTDFYDRLEVRDKEHRDEIMRLVAEFKEERQQLSAIIVANTKVTDELYHLIEKRLLQLRERS